MIAGDELDAVIRAGVFRDREQAVQEAIETLFAVRPQLRLEAAFEMFRSREVSLLRAAEIAGLDFESFRRLAHDRGIPWEIESEGSDEMDRALGDFLAEPHI
jgi:predicted HTH domain antitoxin